MATKHRFKWMYHKGEKIRIDRKIAPLMSELWRLGINTISSCEDYCNLLCPHKWEDRMIDGEKISAVVKTPHCKKNVWLVFEKARDLEKFYNLLLEFDTDYDSAYEKILYQSKFDPDNWAVRYSVVNHGVHGKVRGRIFYETGCKKNKFCVQPQLTFPTKQLPSILEKLRKVK